ncbi:MAG: hypothetical protein JRN15_20950 [Nitrososphaerota archaeon]|nr:hypothetical protein [Nitrososphaerota archaeon]
MESELKLTPRQSALIGAMVVFAVLLAVLLWEFESTDFWLYIAGAVVCGFAFLYFFYQYNVEFVVKNRLKKEPAGKAGQSDTK